MAAKAEECYSNVQKTWTCVFNLVLYCNCHVELLFKEEYITNGTHFHKLV